MAQLLKPILTEKTMRLAQAGQFTFKVNPLIGKQAIKVAVESAFAVDVLKISTISANSKVKRAGKKRLATKAKAYKKAIITLKPGQSISYFEMEKPKKNKKAKK